MKEVRVSPTEATLRLTGREIDLFLNAINESLVLLDDWEFSTRTGFEKEDFRTVHAELKALRDKMEREG
jgi:hypothetical protein